MKESICSAGTNASSMVLPDFGRAIPLHRRDPLGQPVVEFRKG